MIQPVTFTPNMDANTMTAAINDALRQINDYLKNVSATNITVDTINEKTEGHGVTIDGLLVKDGFAENMARDYYSGSTTHLDDIIKSGMYGIYARPESPFGGQICALQVNEYSPDWIVQVIWVVNSSNSAPMQRMRHSGTTWTNWKQLSTVEDIGGAWKAWTPNILSSGGGTAPTYSSVKCTYTQIGKTVLANVSLSNSSGGTPGYGSSLILISLPVTALGSGQDVIGGGQVSEIGPGGVGTTKYAMAKRYGANAINLMYYEGTNVPNDDQSNDSRYIYLTLQYQAA